MTMPIIKTATATDEAAVIAVVVLAFSADPAARWTWPDANQYLMHFPSFVRAFGGKAFAHGHAYYVDGYAGAVLWLPLYGVKATAYSFQPRLTAGVGRLQP
jgi:hypothetical protein